MTVSRLTHITNIGVEQMGELADRLQDPEVLRLENLDTDLRPPLSALEYTKRAVDDDDANSYLPFFGLDVLRQAAADLVGKQSGQHYDWRTEFTFAYARKHANHQAFLQTARRQVCLKATQNAHDVKFPSAIFENYELVSPQWRPHFLAASVRWLHGTQMPDNQAVVAAREALRT